MVRKIIDASSSLKKLELKKITQKMSLQKGKSKKYNESSIRRNKTENSLQLKSFFHCN